MTARLWSLGKIGKSWVEGDSMVARLGVDSGLCIGAPVRLGWTFGDGQGRKMARVTRLWLALPPLRWYMVPQ